MTIANKSGSFRVSTETERLIRSCLPESRMWSDGGDDPLVLAAAIILRLSDLLSIEAEDISAHHVSGDYPRRVSVFYTLDPDADAALPGLGYPADTTLLGHLVVSRGCVQFSLLDEQCIDTFYEDSWQDVESAEDVVAVAGKIGALLESPPKIQAQRKLPLAQPVAEETFHARATRLYPSFEEVIYSNCLRTPESVTIAIGVSSYILYFRGSKTLFSRMGHLIGLPDEHEGIPVEVQFIGKVTPA